MLRQKRVVSCFLESDGRILLLRRSGRVGTYQGRWAAISGYIEKTADEQALTEIAEETGLSGRDIELIRRGQPLEVRDEKLAIRWLVHPYLFRVKDRGKVSIDWEHEEARWLDPKEIDNYPTVPSLKEALARVWPA